MIKSKYFYLDLIGELKSLDGAQLNMLTDQLVKYEPELANMLSLNIWASCQEADLAKEENANLYPSKV